jgi:aryl-alcohol dehydrogenase-like predicted oxidoreductase
MDDLVRSGMVRYIGFSDVPAWKAAQASMLARQYGWSPVIALQIEYSLLERTVEAELVPMALEMGMGITPWSPLAGGALSGKYTRANAGKADIGRGEWVANRLTDKGYAIVDGLIAIGKEIGATPAQVALAWLQSKPGVVSSIIGARTLEQLKDNLGALTGNLSAEHIASLDALSTPALPFPHDFLIRTASVMQGGTTINGRPSEPWPLAPKSDAERY